MNAKYKNAMHTVKLLVKRSKTTIFFLILDNKTELWWLDNLNLMEEG
jgi:hypothetical protein